MIYNKTKCNKNFKKINYITIIIILFSLYFFSTSAKAEENSQDLEFIETSEEQDVVPIEYSTKQADKIIESPSVVESSELKSYDNGKIIVLNKITATSKELNLKIGKSQYFGNIQITLHKCTKNLDPYNEDNYMLFTVTEHKIDEDPMLIFQGWLLSSSISISSLEHPIYEIFSQVCF